MSSADPEDGASPRSKMPRRRSPTASPRRSAPRDQGTPVVLAVVGSPESSSPRSRRRAILQKWSVGTPLVPDRLRRWVFLVTVVAVACVVGLGLATRFSDRGVLFDRPVDSFLTCAPAVVHRIAGVLSDFGQVKVFVTIMVVSVVILLCLRDLPAAVATAVAIIIARLLVEEILKPLFDRHLFRLPGPTFPSGHTTIALRWLGRQCSLCAQAALSVDCSPPRFALS